MCEHSERVLIGRRGAYTVHAKYDSREMTKAARAAFVSKFEREVDPEGVLPCEERLRRAEMARKAHFTRLALQSAQARRKRGNRAPGESVVAVLAVEYDPPDRWKTLCDRQGVVLVWPGSFDRLDAVIAAARART
jgi:hypothetical protein